MIKGILFFIVVWALVSTGIQVFRFLNNMERWDLTKTIAYGSLTAFIAFAIVGSIVVLF